MLQVSLNYRAKLSKNNGAGETAEQQRTLAHPNKHRFRSLQAKQKPSVVCTVVLPALWRRRQKNQDFKPGLVAHACSVAVHRWRSEKQN